MKRVKAIHMVAGIKIIGLALTLGFALPGASMADDSCGLCAKSVIINAALASCFLERFPQLSSRSANAVAINLDDCEETRSVVPALRGPRPKSAEPSRKFFLSLSQMVCLKHKLEEPGLELDPSAQIDLGAC